MQICTTLDGFALPKCMKFGLVSYNDLLVKRVVQQVYHKPT